MHPIEVREQHQNLTEEIITLAEAGHVMMRALTTDMDHALLERAKRLIWECSERLQLLAMRLG